MDIDKLRSAWPHVRTLLIGFHIVSVIALSLPTPHAVSSRDKWQNPNMQGDLEQWSKRLDFLGYESAKDLEDDLWDLAQGYLAVRKTFIIPFQDYSKYGGSRQGWRMFANPRIEPAVLHIDIMTAGSETWQPVYRPHSDRYNFWGERFRHNRMRKLMGRLGNEDMTGHYRFLVKFMAPRVARAFKDAEKLRFRLFRYRTLSPEQVRAGEEEKGKYERVIILSAEDYR